MSGHAFGSLGSRPLIERFLGREAASGRLHSLLGLFENPSDDEIIAGLQRSLAKLDEHPQGRTPEADEVRLALHAAAAQLLDRAVRTQVGERAKVAKDSSRATKVRLEQDVLITLARYGGWNRRALRRLTTLALARGAGPDEVADVLRHLASRRRSTTQSATPRRRRKAARPLRPAPADVLSEPAVAAPHEPSPEIEADRRRLMLVVGSLATLLALVVAVALIVIASTSGRSRGAQPDPGRSAAAPPAAKPAELPMAGGEELFPWKGAQPQAKRDKPDEAAAPRYSRLSDAVAALDSAADGLAIDPAQAVRVFDGAFAGVGAQWCGLTVPQQRAAQHDVVEFVYRAVQLPEMAEAVVGAVARGAAPLGRKDQQILAAEIWPAAWSVGMLARLAREQDMGAVASRAVEARLREVVGSSVAVSSGFEQGVQAALWTMLPGLVAGAETAGRDEAWQKWIDASRFGDADSPRTLLSALEWVVVGAAEPTESEVVRKAIEALVLRCDWREGSTARDWLVRMFSDTRVSDADLHAITTTLARRSQAPGVDATMALPVRASADARQAMRERYAAAWGLSLEGPSLDDLAGDWLKAAREVLQPPSTEVTTVTRLARAVNLSRLSQAAQLRFNGKLDDAGVLIDEFDRPVEMELTRWNQRQAAERLDTDAAMSRWALAYLSAQRDFPERLRLLADARSQNFTSPTDAEVLVTEAVRGSPAQARVAAREALLAQRPGAALTLAMLEILPRMPRTPQNAELVAALTSTTTMSVNDPDWKLRTRRVLVQTALEQLAAEGEAGIIDDLAAVLGESYAARATGDGPLSEGATPPKIPPDQAAAMLRAQWERLARRGGLGSEVIEVESVLARHAARLGLAEGPVQTFAAEQMAAFELMSVAVGAERIDRSGDVKGIRDAVRERRRAAKDVIEQILVVEEGTLDLWAVRLGQEQP
ncbi:MAG: hypothetical protein IPJ41_09050 [Phycisphaerales bacterium]|nr:hypothetical protein [Phycisphaerales bacterium]